jgi:hypothetical protein
LADVARYEGIMTTAAQKRLDELCAKGEMRELYGDDSSDDDDIGDDLIKVQECKSLNRFPCARLCMGERVSRLSIRE